MITSAHFKSSNSPGFNPILQKFYKMICEIIVSKTICGIFLIFCRSFFINNFMVKNSFSEPKNERKLKYLEIHVYLKKFRTPFCRSYLYKLAGRIFFRKNSFRGLFFIKKWFYTFFQRWLFNFNIILKTCFKNLFKKTVKNWWFYSFK